MLYDIILVHISNFHTSIGAVNFDERFAEAVGFSHNDEYTVGTVWFGTPLQNPSPPSKKKKLDDIFKRVE